MSSDNWKSYQNGNTKVYLNLDDGTKIRTTDDDADWKPEFPESADVTISTYCEHGCEYCYAGCSKNGSHADFSKYKSLLNSLRPYTELAVNINSELHPDFEEFIKELSDRGVVVNATLRQDDFENDEMRAKIEDWCRRGYLHGIGISLMNPTGKFIKLAKQNPNYVIHTIAGLTPLCHYEALADNNLKILILGYKLTHRGSTYYASHDNLPNRIYELSVSLDKLIGRFAVISFDNLAIEQFGIEAMMSPEEFEQFYMGDDGEFTMAINLVDGTFASSSISELLYDIPENATIDDLFAVVQKEVDDGKDAL